jgi:hypothetical protein
LRGCLWNSFVMVGSVQALLGITESAIPQLYDSLSASLLFLARRRNLGSSKNFTSEWSK